MAADIEIGHIFQNVQRPRRLWRVSRIANGVFMLERTDNPNIMRFVPFEGITDLNRYVPMPAPAITGRIPD